jgi:hypothetical protein
MSKPGDIAAGRGTRTDGETVFKAQRTWSQMMRAGMAEVDKERTIIEVDGGIGWMEMKGVIGLKAAGGG